ncbi:MAG: chlorophyll synthesis pathway protein BchC [Myxococcales bacterium]|nr:chlorophyll synthesis pathway protein BchC [Myxococcales bacterium]
METLAVILEQPESVAVRAVELSDPREGDLLIRVEWSGISAGTERLLWSGQMPPFPGLGYPLVPGYESVGQVLEVFGATELASGARSRAQPGGEGWDGSAGPGPQDLRPGERVFVPGAHAFKDVRALFGGAAAHLVVPAARVARLPASLEEQGVLLALAATAQHALQGGALPELIVGHGVLGRLLARLAVSAGKTPVVWETNPIRRDGAIGYTVLSPDADPRRDYASIYDASGDAGLLDALVGRLGKRGEIVLAGFYHQRPSFDFAPAFMREARFRIAAEWQREDLDAVIALIDAGQLALDELITHRLPAASASAAYTTAFSDPSCLKMLLDWRDQA